MVLQQPFAGEIHETVAGFPCTYKYIPPATAPTDNDSSVQLPLVVLIPGGANHARIYYGGHAGYDEDAFLATWLARLGFPVLAITYPWEMTTTAPAMDGAGFRLTDWGKQAAYVTRKILDAKLPDQQRTVILACWSMGGRMVVPYSEVASRECGFEVGLIVSLCATQGFGSMRPVPQGIICTGNGFADCDGLLEGFLRQIKEQDARNNGGGLRPAIEAGVYERWYFGYTPVSLHGWRLRYERDGQTQEHRFVEDLYGAEEDAAPADGDFSRMPWIATIACTDAVDARHVLLDEVMWKGWTAQRMTALWEGLQKISRERERPCWETFRSFVAQLAEPGVLHRTVEGNHFFFLGKEGAKATASMILDLWDERNRVHGQFIEILETRSNVGER